MDSKASDSMNSPIPCCPPNRSLSRIHLGRLGHEGKVPDGNGIEKNDISRLGLDGTQFLESTDDHHIEATSTMICSRIRTPRNWITISQHWLCLPSFYFTPFSIISTQLHSEPPPICNVACCLRFHFYTLIFGTHPGHLGRISQRQTGQWLAFLSRRFPNTKSRR